MPNPPSKLIPICIALAMFMENLDATIINTAIPQMAAHLHVSPLLLKFSLTAYLISLAIFIPISGYLAEKFGTRNVFSFAIGIFTLSSLGCALADNLPLLVLARICQGMGGAMMMPVGRLIILRTFPKEDLIMANNYIAVPALIGPILGPLFGGVIVSYLSWRWIFLINLPFGMIGIWLVRKYIGNYYAVAPVKLNIFEFLCFGLGMASLALWLQLLGENLINPVFLKWILLASAMGFISYITISLNNPTPLINLQLFKIRTFKITMLGSLCARISIGAMPFLLPLLWQTNFGFSPMLSGALMVPQALGMMSMKFFVTRLLAKIGFKKALIINTVLSGGSILIFSILSAHDSLVVLIIAVFFYGLISSLQFSCLNSLIYADLPVEMTAQGTSIASTIQQFSRGLGIAFAALILHLLLHEHDLTKSPIAFSQTFIVIGLFTAFSSGVFLFLHQDDGRNVSHAH